MGEVQEGSEESHGIKKHPFFPNDRFQSCQNIHDSSPAKLPRQCFSPVNLRAAFCNRLLRVRIISRFHLEARYTSKWIAIWHNPPKTGYLPLASFAASAAMNRSICSFNCASTSSAIVTTVGKQRAEFQIVRVLVQRGKNGDLQKTRLLLPASLLYSLVYAANPRGDPRPP